MESIDRTVGAILRAEHEAVEAACEKALQGGTCGVLVVRNRDFRLVKAEPDPFVPYGHIYEWNHGISAAVEDD